MRQTLRWQRLEQKGARQQRLLWASTGTKDPRYSDVMYVESLIGPDTVVTVPPDTLKKFEDHGRISIALSADVATNHRVVLNALAAGGIDFVDVNRTLENEGIAKFAASSGQLLSVIARKRREGRISN
jgi:transaldolase/glucose-6-phosphate isomerase